MYIYTYIHQYCTVHGVYLCRVALGVGVQENAVVSSELNIRKISISFSPMGSR